MIKKLREVRETSGLELDEEEAEPTIGRNFKTKFEIPNEYSENILITDSDFILSDRTIAICITADKKATQEVAGTVHDHGSTPAGTVLPLEYRASSALGKSEASCPISRGLVRTAEYGGTRVPIGRASMRSERERHQRKE